MFLLVECSFILEKLTSPYKTGIRSLLHRAQKAVEYGFLRRCRPDSVERFAPPPSEPRYAALESTEAQTGDATPVSDITCISEGPTESVQSRSNSVPECSDFVLPGEVPVETIGSSDTTRVNITTIAEDDVEKIDKRLRWKKTRSLFRRARERLCSGAGVEESSEPLTDSTQTLELEELSDGMLSGSESIPETTLPGEVLFEPAVAPGMEAGLVEKGSAGETQSRYYFAGLSTFICSIIDRNVRVKCKLFGSHFILVCESVIGYN